MSTSDLWTYRDQTWAGTDISGFDVEAADGGIGSVDEATYEAGGSWLVVDTGPWIFGKKVMLPAGVVDRVDANGRKVWVNRTKDEIKNAPEFDETRYREEDYRSEVGGYYGGLGAATAATTGWGTPGLAGDESTGGATSTAARHAPGAMPGGMGGSDPGESEREF